MKRLILAASLLCLGVSACATGEFFEVYKKHYGIKEGSKLDTLSCANCHKSDDGVGFNPYGQMLKDTIKSTGAAGVTDAVLAAVDDKDADGDGTPNGVEAKADTPPGDPKIGGDPKKAATAAAAPAEESAFPPKNGFHPAVVHFPIALFIGGLILDLIGALRKDKTLLQAGWYNIVFAAITCFGGIASGFLAALLMKMPLKGTVMEHIELAAGSTVLMIIMVFMRLHRHEKMVPTMRLIYYILATGALVMISMAGHVGGVVAGTG